MVSFAIVALADELYCELMERGHKLNPQLLMDDNLAELLEGINLARGDRDLYRTLYFSPCSIAGSFTTTGAVYG